MKVYLAGPMSGIPQFNYPAFAQMAGALRKVVTNPGEHIEVMSPPEEDPPHVQEASLASRDGNLDTLDTHGISHGQFVGLGVQRIIDGKFDAIVILPGWEKSRGARVEVMAGVVSGAKIARVDYAYGGRPYIVEIPRSELIRGLEGGHEVQPL